VLPLTVTVSARANVCFVVVSVSKVPLGIVRFLPGVVLNATVPCCRISDTGTVDVPRANLNAEPLASCGDAPAV
jgi:hypothetical protein